MTDGGSQTPVRFVPHKEVRDIILELYNNGMDTNYAHALMAMNLSKIIGNAVQYIYITKIQTGYTARLSPKKPCDKICTFGDLLQDIIGVPFDSISDTLHMYIDKYGELFVDYAGKSTYIRMNRRDDKHAKLLQRLNNQIQRANDASHITINSLTVNIGKEICDYIGYRMPHWKMTVPDGLITAGERAIGIEITDQFNRTRNESDPEKPRAILTCYNKHCVHVFYNKKMVHADGDIAPGIMFEIRKTSTSIKPLRKFCWKLDEDNIYSIIKCTVDAMKYNMERVLVSTSPDIMIRLLQCRADRG